MIWKTTVGGLPGAGSFDSAVAIEITNREVSGEIISVDSNEDSIIVVMVYGPGGRGGQLVKSTSY